MRIWFSKCLYRGCSVDISCLWVLVYVCVFVCLRGCEHIWPFPFQVQSESRVVQTDSDRLLIAVVRTDHSLYMKQGKLLFFLCCSTKLSAAETSNMSEQTLKAFFSSFTSCQKCCNQCVTKRLYLNTDTILCFWEGLIQFHFVEIASETFSNTEKQWNSL